MEEKRKYLEYFDGAFDSTVAEKTKPENKPYVAYSKIDGVVYTIIPKEDMYTVYKLVRKDISNCTYNMVDLGLPSGTLWADRNVGAASPEDYGSYFQWGDTNAYTCEVGEITAAELAEGLNSLLGSIVGEITAENVSGILEMMGTTGTDLTDTSIPTGGFGFSLDKVFDLNSYFDTTDGGSTFNKYNNNGGLTVLESIDDAASVHMGSQYRIPTREQYIELVNETNVTNILRDYNGNEYLVTFDDSTDGDKDSYTVSPELPEGVDIWSLRLDRTIFTNKSDSSKSIYFKANGLGYSDKPITYDIDFQGNYWSSSLFGDSTAGYLGFKQGYTTCWQGRGREIGCGVRGVQA